VVRRVAPVLLCSVFLLGLILFLSIEDRVHRVRIVAYRTAWRAVSAPRPDEWSWWGCTGSEGSDEVFAAFAAECVSELKQSAVNTARVQGLVSDESLTGVDEQTWEAYRDRPGFLGIEIWGMQVGYTPALPDNPGGEGLPMAVYVTHVFELQNPVIRSWAVSLEITAVARMITEGYSVCFGPPPDYETFPKCGAWHPDGRCWTFHQPVSYVVGWVLGQLACLCVLVSAVPWGVQALIRRVRRVQ